MSRLVLIFGAFNPVTNAHINMGVCAKQAYTNVNVIYIPSNDVFLSGWKGLGGGKILDGGIRLNLLQEAVNNYGFYVSDVEVSGILDGKTYNTIQYYKECDPIICIGADKLCELHKWYKGEEIVRDNEFLVITRENNKGDLHESLNRYRDNFKYMEGKYQNVSSTKVRDAYISKRLESIKGFIPECVYGYLKSKENIYV